MVNEVEKPPYQRQYRWVMLALASLLYFSFGLVMSSLPPLVTPILRDLNLPYTQMGIIFGSWPLVYVLVALVGGAIIDRWGIRKSLFVGVVIIGLSASLRYFVNGFATMVLFVALFGLGGPMISIGCPKTVATWFRGKDRATAIGIYSASSAAGGLIALSMTNSVVMPLTGYSWRLTFVSYGLVVFVVALLWLFLARDVKTAETVERTSVIRVFRNLIGVRNIRLILIIGFLSMLIGQGFTNWLPKLLESGGLPPAIAGFGASIPVLVGIPSVMFIPRLIPLHLRGRFVSVGYFATAIVMMLIATSSGGLLATWLALDGLFFRIEMPLMMLILMDMPEVGSKYMGSVGGMYFCVAEIGGVVGPSLMGLIRDMTGGFLVGVGFLSGLGVIVSVIALLIRIGPTSDAKASQ